jgi:hypothetical protein
LKRAGSTLGCSTKQKKKKKIDIWTDDLKILHLSYAKFHFVFLKLQILGI